MRPGWSELYKKFSVECSLAVTCTSYSFTDFIWEPWRQILYIIKYGKIVMIHSAFSFGMLLISILSGSMSLFWYRQKVVINPPFSPWTTAIGWGISGISNATVQTLVKSLMVAFLICIETHWCTIWDDTQPPSNCSERIHHRMAALAHKWLWRKNK